MSSDLFSLEKKKERIANLFSGKPQDKVPFYLKTDGYLSYFTGRGCPANIHSWEEAVAVNVEACNALNPDAIHFFTPYHLVIPDFAQLLGGSSRCLSETGVPQLDAQNVVIMSDSEYAKLLDDPAEYLINEVYPRRYPKLRKEVPAEERKAALAQAMGVIGKMGGLFNECEEKAQTIAFSQSAMVNGVDQIFDYYRDFVGISKDLRRCPDLLREVGLKMTEQILSMANGVEPIPYKVVEIPCHLGAYISPKQFERIYWPSFKLLVDTLHDKGFNVDLMLEKNYTHVHYLLQDLPSDRIMCLMEEDDLEQSRKDLPNLILAGGLSQKLMAYGTKEMVEAHVKWLIDVMAADGKFVIAPTIPFMIPGDCAYENMQTAAGIIATYGVK